MQVRFKKLNENWNADPNVPYPEVTFTARQVQVRFYLNHAKYPRFHPDQKGILTFKGCSRWRLGDTNDEGWYMNRCRYSGIAPEWGQFYEITDDDALRTVTQDWHVLTTEPDEENLRHFLFYFRDDTFECLAHDWSFIPGPPTREN